MKGYCCSIIACSKNQSEILKNIASRLIQFFQKELEHNDFKQVLLIADGDFSSHPTVITTNVIQGRGGIRRNLKGQSSIGGLAVCDPIGVFATGVTFTGIGGN